MGCDWKGKLLCGFLYFTKPRKPYPCPYPHPHPHPSSPTPISSSPTPVPSFTYLNYSTQLAQLLGPNTTEAATFICSHFAVIYSKISDSAYAVDSYSQCSSASPCSAQAPSAMISNLGARMVSDLGAGMVSDMECDGLGNGESGLFAGSGCEVVWVVCRRRF
ncbi:PREDICTED: ammonium transporter 1 member 1 [Prunus dulcis]|uniref:PREDICTED: ammonium transporter 1 member 1 n=1 Tax=Prunus dulcis TaxID=3755 RepID=A0A5E4FRW4_PRUDU|nr:PREDICTED: ammonium transporter 1 member 1 [Prunus dulcis]